MDLHQERARRFDGSSLPRSKELGDIEITEVEVLDAGGSAAQVFRSDEPAQIRFHYNAYQSLGKVQASAFIIRSDGLTCCMVRSKLNHFDLFVDRGRGVITVRLEPLQLVSGTYFVEVWFLNESDSLSLISKAGRSNWFSVKGSALSYEESGGIFEPHARWNYSRTEKSRIEGNLAKVGTDTLRGIAWNREQ